MLTFSRRVLRMVQIGKEDHSASINSGGFGVMSKYTLETLVHSLLALSQLVERAL